MISFPCAYVDAFDLAKLSISKRKGFATYPEGATRTIALQCVGASSEERLIQAVSKGMHTIELSAADSTHWDWS